MLFFTIVVFILDAVSVYLMSPSKEDFSLFTVLMSEKDMPLLRELVGSIHIYDPQRKLIVFSHSNKAIEQEVALWKRVEFIDINLHLFYSTSRTRNEKLVLQRAYDYLNSKTGKFKFVKLGQIWVDSLAPSNPERDQFSCLIEIKKEHVFTEPEIFPVPLSQKTKVAFLVPTLNTEFSNNPSIKSFLLKSLKETITREELGRLAISIYIGYDEGDVVFDHRDHDSIMTDLQLEFPDFRFRPIKMLKTHWLTFIWNRLFAIAYREGNDAFFQINDDVQFQNNTWLGPTVDLLQSAKVVGLNDSLWNCKLFTQALVGRSHFARFGGFFFPPGIKNWYSDNWITSIYGPEHSKCSAIAQIKNSNINTRYSGCRKYRL